MSSSRVVALACAAAAFSTCFNGCGGATARTGRQDVFAEPRAREDAEKSASGYIYRTDGENPPVFIKLGEGDNDDFDAILESFKKEHGFRDVPPMVTNDVRESPFHIPVVGQEHTIRYKDRSGVYGSDSRYRGANMFFADDFGDDRRHFGATADFDDHDNDDDGGGGGGGFDFGPFKYHRDVSSAVEGLTGDGFDDQNYYGSPYTHNEYKSPGRYHSKAGGGGGSFQKAGHYFSHGSSADSGHKNQHGFDNGHSGKYGKDVLKGHYKKTAGHAASHADAADHYGEHQSGGHGSKGHKFGEHESHKKGHKTTGFHNVYHKDEYNKEQKFYDDAHKHGKHDRYGGKHKDYAHKDGGHQHGGHRDVGYTETHKTGAGQFAKGGYHEGHEGHGIETGHKSHHDHKAEYDTLSDNKKYGEHESGGSGGGDDFY